MSRDGIKVFSQKKILIAAGGTGGHLFPAQDLASDLEGKAEVMIAGHNLKTSPFFKRTIPFHDILACAPKRGQWIRFVLETFIGFWQSFWLLRRFSPDVVVGFGSYHTFPVLLAAYFLRKKMILFEANCVLGKVNRFFAKRSGKVAVQFPLLKDFGNSVLISLLPWSKKGQKTIPSREEALAYFGLDPNLKTFLVFGGSQGAAFLNDVMPKAAMLLSQDFAFQVIHCTGKANRVDYGVLSCVKEFEPRMDLAYAAADLVICRSGAGTVAELIRYCKPSLLIPFPSASDNHQWENGRLLADVFQGGRLLDQKEATPEVIREEILALLQELPSRKKALSRLDAKGRKDLAALVLEEALYD